MTTNHESLGTSPTQGLPAFESDTTFLNDHIRLPFEVEDPVKREARLMGDNPAGVIELSDAELRGALSAKPICSENASISTTWCNNPNVC